MAPPGLAGELGIALASSGRHRRQGALHQHGVVGAGDLDVHELVEVLLPLDSVPAAAAGPLLGGEPLGVLRAQVRPASSHDGLKVSVGPDEVSR